MREGTTAYRVRCAPGDGFLKRPHGASCRIARMDFLGLNFALASLDDAGTFSGIGSDWTMNRNGWQYMPGAFTASLQAHKARGTMPAMLLHHDRSRPVGSWKSIEPKADGLHVHGSIARDTADGADAYNLLRAGALQALSTGAHHLQSEPVKGTEGRRTGDLVSKADLFEISLVSVPGNPNAKIIRVNSLGAARDIEELLHDAGLSSRKAKAAASAAWRAINTTAEPEFDPAISTLLSGATAALARFKRK